jgi:hypothetical protein
VVKSAAAIHVCDCPRASQGLGAGLKPARARHVLFAVLSPAPLPLPPAAQTGISSESDLIFWLRHFAINKACLSAVLCHRLRHLRRETSCSLSSTIRLCSDVPSALLDSVGLGFMDWRCRPAVCRHPACLRYHCDRSRSVRRCLGPAVRLAYQSKRKLASAVAVTQSVCPAVF